ncbi:MAG: LysM domain-containing protein [Phycisphaeraceae bacterium]
MKPTYYIALLLGIGVCTFAVGYRIMVPGSEGEVLTGSDEVSAGSGLKPPPADTVLVADGRPSIVSNRSSPEAGEGEDSPGARTRGPLIPVNTVEPTPRVSSGPLIPAGLADQTDAVAEDEATADRAAESGDTGAGTETALSEPPRPGAQRTVLRATPAESGPEPRTYEVSEGDTLSTISDELFGSSRYWVDLARANPTVDPIRLQIGQTIVIPAIDAGTESGALTDKEAGIRAPRAVQRHTIRPGESLSSISVRYYGTATHWRVIFNANRSSIGPDPNAVRAGMSIVIPSVPVRERDDD